MKRCGVKKVNYTVEEIEQIKLKEAQKEKSIKQAKLFELKVKQNELKRELEDIEEELKQYAI